MSYTLAKIVKEAHGKPKMFINGLCSKRNAKTQVRKYIKVKLSK